MEKYDILGSTAGGAVQDIPDISGIVNKINIDNIETKPFDKKQMSIVTQFWEF